MKVQSRGAHHIVAVKLRSTSGRARYIAVNNAAIMGEDLVGLHFGETFSILFADIVSSVSIETGKDLGRESFG